MKEYMKPGTYADGWECSENCVTGITHLHGRSSNIVVDGKLLPPNTEYTITFKRETFTPASKPPEAPPSLHAKLNSTPVLKRIIGFYREFSAHHNAIMGPRDDASGRSTPGKFDEQWEKLRQETVGMATQWLTNEFADPLVRSHLRGIVSELTGLAKKHSVDFLA